MILDRCKGTTILKTMTSQEIITELAALGSETISRILQNHGAKQPCFGVKVEDLKKVLKKIKNNHDIAIELFNSGIYDAMYLAGLAMDGKTMAREELDAWARTAYGSGISEYTVPWVASEHPEGYSLALEWIQSPEEAVAVSGWAALSSIVSVKPDLELDIPGLHGLLNYVEKHIHQAPNRVRYTMNGFVICCGSYVSALTVEAKRVAGMIGTVKVEMGGTACKVPSSADYIQKMEVKGLIGKKRKTAKC